MPYRTRHFAFFILLCVATLAHPAWGQERLTGQLLLNTTALKPGGDHVAAVIFDIADKFHAQSHKPIDEFAVPFDVTFDKSPGLTLGPIQYPPGIVHDYKALGKISVYEGHTVIFIPIKVDPAAKPGAITLSTKLSYQICDDKACFQPEEKPVTLKTEILPAGQEVQPANVEVFKSYKPGPTTQPGAARAVATGTPKAPKAASPVLYDGDYKPGSVLAAFGLAFLVGIIFNVMPCVLPVLPLKIIGFYEVSQHNRGRTVFLAGIFSLGVIAVFILLALLVPVFKVFTWGEQFSNPWFAWSVVVLMLGMGLAMFGVFSFVLPTSVYNFSPRHDTAGGNFFWGVLTAAFSTPCTAPLFPPLLLWASGHPTWIGVPAVAMVGVGMSFPYLVLSIFPEAMRKFPRVGPWAEMVKQMTGFILLGFAVYFAATRLIPSPFYWWAPVPVAAAASFWLLDRTIRIAPRVAAVVISSCIAVMVTGSVAALAMRMTGWSATGATASVPWEHYSDDTFAKARAGHQIVLVKFTAGWCLSCQFVEASVFHDAATVELLKQNKVIAIKADLTARDAAGWTLLRKLNSTGGIPLTAVYAPNSTDPVQLAGVYGTQSLADVIHGAAANSK